MNGTTAFDPHLDRAVPVAYLFPPGSNSTVRFFNPYDFNYTEFGGFSGFPGQPIAFASAVGCYFPLSGNYCTLNRFLFLTEVLFALGTLLLGYVWLSSIAVAAVLNYSTVAAAHMIVLRCVHGNSSLDLDNQATSLIVVNSIFFAYPLLQWSKLLRKKDYTNTRYIIACWAILLSISATISEYGPVDSPGFPPVAEIYFQSFDLLKNQRYILLGRWYPDTINPLLMDINQVKHGSLNRTLGSCTPVSPDLISSLRQGQSVVAAPHYTRFIVTRSYDALTSAFAVYSVVTAAATVAATFHGKHTTRYVRAKGYLAIAGSGNQTWRGLCALVLALTYYVIHFLVGLVSLPIAMVIFVINEIELENYPGSDNSTYIGQWGAWVGAAIVFIAVAMNESSFVPTTGKLLVWAASTPLARLFPNQFSPRKRPEVKLTFDLLRKMKDAAHCVGHFFKEEFTSTMQWIRDPKHASKDCIDDEDKDTIATHGVVTQSVLAGASAKVVHQPSPTYGLNMSQSWGMPPL